MYRHILIPTDGSELAGRAVRHGLALAKSAGAKVTALTVEPSFDVYTVPASRVYEISGAFAEHAERAKARKGGEEEGLLPLRAPLWFVPAFVRSPGWRRRRQDRGKFQEWRAHRHAAEDG